MKKTSKQKSRDIVPWELGPSHLQNNALQVGQKSMKVIQTLCPYKKVDQTRLIFCSCILQK